MRSKKDFTFSDGGTVKVHEISSSDLDALEELSTEALTTQYNDPVLAVFARNHYPVLFACTDNPPSLEVAYKKSPVDVDNWFLLASQLNPDFFEKQTYTEREIKLNGKKVVIKSRRPSVELRLAKLQQETLEAEPLTNAKDEEYRINGYIGAAAASFGNIPTAYQAKHELSLKDFGLWHKTVRELIPEWYEEPVKTETVETKKKSENAPDNLQVPA